jgi:cytochrome c556
MKPVWLVLIAAGTFAQTTAFAQTSGDTSMRQLMLDLIQPASNDLLLFVNRGGSKNDGEWATVRRSALTLAESGTLLTIRGRARDQGDWVKDANNLADVGRVAYRAAEAKDLSALLQLTESLDAACTTCHKQYRPNVFPREGASK